MISLKKNGISLLGWFVFVGLYYFLISLFIDYLPKIMAGLPTIEISRLTFLVTILLCAMILGFLAFIISLRLVVFPISRRSNFTVTKPKYPLILEWLVFCFLYFIYCIPIGFIESIKEYIPISPGLMTGIIKPTWQALVTLWLYRENVFVYISVPTNQPKSAEAQLQEPTI